MQTTTSTVTWDGVAAHIVYDAGEIPNADDVRTLFIGAGEALDGGRGGVVLVDVNGGQYVRRHYRRGGLPAKFVKDRYRWKGLAATRAWREFELTAQLWAAGFPTVQPVAARVVRDGGWGCWYRADLVTAYTPARPWSAQLDDSTPEVWEAIGRVVKRMHELNVDHPDLNAHNILLGADKTQPLVMDFDRGSIRADGAWKQKNCERLKRSLDKISTDTQTAMVCAGWQRFLAAYASA